jgi:hypothetical protein
MDFFMEKCLPVLLLALLLALCWLVGTLPAGAVEGGPSSVLFWGFVAGAIMAAFCGWLGYMFTDMASYRSDPRVGAGVVAVLAFVCTFWAPGHTLLNGHNEAAYLREMAPKVVAFGLRHFDEIDTDRNGEMNETEMDNALERLSLSGSEREILSLMIAQRSDAGHVIGSSTSTTYVWIPVGDKGGGYMSPITTTTYYYAINRADLEGYPARVKEKYKHW